MHEETSMWERFLPRRIDGGNLSILYVLDRHNIFMPQPNCLVLNGEARVPRRLQLKIWSILSEQGMRNGMRSKVMR